jgi:hypothetical protein
VWAERTFQEPTVSFEIPITDGRLSSYFQRNKQLNIRTGVSWRWFELACCGVVGHCVAGRDRCGAVAWPRPIVTRVWPAAAGERGWARPGVVGCHFMWCGGNI